MTRVRITELPTRDGAVEAAIAALPALMAHVQNHVQPEYVKLGRLGALTVNAIKADLQEAREALASRNGPALLRLHSRLKEYRT